MELQKLRDILQRKGYSMTAVRRQVFELLDGHESQTMQVLISRAKGQIDRASVYRTVDLFERLGIVHRINIGWKYKIELTDLFLYHHHHFHCQKCGVTIVLPENSTLENNIRILAKTIGAKPTGHQLEIQGICQNCQTD
jgi:Fur family ferric uptake transcriptional regulator